MPLSSKETKLLRTSGCISYELPKAILDSYGKKEKKKAMPFLYYALNNHLICKSNLCDYKYHSSFSMDVHGQD